MNGNMQALLRTDLHYLTMLSHAQAEAGLHTNLMLLLVMACSAPMMIALDLCQESLHMGLPVLQC